MVLISLLSAKVKICADGEKINRHRYHIPHHDGHGLDQKAVIDPDDLEGAHDRGHGGIHSLAGPPLEHRDQIGHGGKSRSESCHEANNLMQRKRRHQHCVCAFPAWSFVDMVALLLVFILQTETPASSHLSCLQRSSPWHWPRRALLSTRPLWDVRSYAYSRFESAWCTNPMKRAPVPAALPQPSRRSARDAAIRDILETSIHGRHASVGSRKPAEC